MPNLPPKPCVICSTLVYNGTTRCSAHALPKRAWGNRDGAHVPRTRGRKLQDARKRLFRAHPFCAECERKGLTVLAVERDHIKPLAEGGTDTEDNVQGLCIPCHEAKSKRESLAGIKRKQFYYGQ